MFRKKSEAVSRPVVGAQQPIRSPGSTGPVSQPKKPLDHQPTWIPPGSSVTIGPWTVPGMVYVGSGLRAPTGQVEPALIDPSLPVDIRKPDWDGQGLDYWPSYDTVPPASRAAYLAWHADGRRHPTVPLGYVFLYFYGLERRVLVDGGSAKDPAAMADVGAIRAEVERLLAIYGANRSFRGYAGSFLDLLQVMHSEDGDASAGPPPAVPQAKWPVSMRLRLALGEMALAKRPIPADWAMAWALSHPGIWPRTPAQRCPQLFSRLFMIRYAEQHGDGLVVRPTSSRIALDYTTASAGLGGRVNIQVQDLPDVVEAAKPTQALTELVESCADELDAYSRWLGRNPSGEGSLAAAALLPAVLLDYSQPELSRLRVWIEDRLASDPSAVIDASELLTRWPTVTPGKVTKKDHVALAQLLDNVGYGIEPDTRMGGPVLISGPAVLFRGSGSAAVTASRAYTAATALLHLAAAVAAADGSVSEAEQQHLVAHLESSLHLTQSERTRLHAHLRWRLAAGTKLTGLKSRLVILTQDQRAAIGDFLVTVAAADGVIAPDEVTTLTKIYRLLDLDPESVYSHIHSATTTARVTRPRPALDPVVVREASAVDEVYVVPPPRPPAGHPERDPVGRGTVTLDPELIEAKLAETAAVAILLTSIFTEDDAATLTPNPPVGASAVAVNADGAAPRPRVLDAEPAVAGLDVAHSQLLRALAQRALWPRSDFDDLVESLGLLPDGALDLINEAAYETTGDPVAEGDDPIEMNPEALQEMLP